MFKKAVKHESKLRLAIAGPSGSGKTYTALAVGTALGKVAFADTEHGSASKYADLFDFDVVNIQPPFHPDKFVEVIKQAAAMGYDVVILDSLTHAWNGSGGLLEVVDEIAKRMKTVNTFAAWKDATPIQNRLVDSIVTAPIHVIATMRSKQEYVLEQIERNGRTISQPKKVGMAPIQRDSFEYEFDIYLDMTIENDAIVGKTRCPALQGKVISRPGANLAETLQDWLSGEALPPKVYTTKEQLLTANDMTFAQLAFNTECGQTAFAQIGNVEAWVSHIVGEEKPIITALVAAFFVYCNAVTDGASKREAAAAAATRYADLVAEGAARDLFGEPVASNSQVTGAYQD